MGRELPNIPSPKLYSYAIRSFAKGLSQAVDPSLLPVGVASDLSNVDVSTGLLKRANGITKLYGDACAENIKCLMKFYPAFGAGVLLGCSDTGVYRRGASSWTKILNLTANVAAQLSIYNSPWDMFSLGTGAKTVKMRFDGSALKTATVNATAGTSVSGTSPATDIQSLGNKQIETVEVLTDATKTGTISVRITASFLPNAYRDVSVSVTKGNTKETVASKIASKLSADAEIKAYFGAASSGADVYIRRRLTAANDDTLAITLQNAGGTGVTFGASQDTLAGSITDCAFKISVDGDTAETVTLDTTDKNTGVLVAAEMQTQIQLLGGNKANVTVDYNVTNAGKYTIKSAKLGKTSSIAITSADVDDISDYLKIGAANGGTETTGAATSDCDDLSAVTATELAAVFTRDFADVSGLTVTVYGTTVKLTSPTTGIASAITVDGGGTLNTILGLPATTTIIYGAASTAVQGANYDYIGYQIGTKDILIFSNGAGKIYKYDGSTVSELDEAPATAKAIELAEDQERVWIISSNNTLKYCDDLDPENWTEALDEGGFIEVPSWDGETLVGLKYAFGRIIITKEHSIWTITGTVPSNFRKEKMYASRGAIANKTMVFCENIMPFLAYDGVYYFDGANVLPLNTDDIKNHIANINQSYIRYAVATYFNRKYILAIPTGVSTTNNLILEYDFRTKAWTVREGMTVCDFMEFNKTLYVATGNGYVHLYDSGDTNDGEAIAAEWISGVFGADSPDMVKSIEKLYLTISGDAGEAVYFDYWIDNQTMQTVTITLAATDTFGDYDLSGEGERIRFRFRNVDGADFTIKNPVVKFSVTEA